ncbi:MAG: hypothetical protein ACJAS3_003366 [Roseivirga sp.]
MLRVTFSKLYLFKSAISLYIDRIKWTKSSNSCFMPIILSSLLRLYLLFVAKVYSIAYERLRQVDVILAPIGYIRCVIHICGKYISRNLSKLPYSIQGRHKEVYSRSVFSNGNRAFLLDAIEEEWAKLVVIFRDAETPRANSGQHDASNCNCFDEKNSVCRQSYY